MGLTLGSVTITLYYFDARTHLPLYHRVQNWNARKSDPEIITLNARYRLEKGLRNKSELASTVFPYVRAETVYVRSPRAP